MKTKRLIKTLAVVTILFAGTVSAQAGFFGHRHGGYDKEGSFIGIRIIEHLDLSDEQENKVANIIIQHRDELKSAREKMVVAREGMHKVMEAEQFNETDLRHAYQNVASAREEMVVLRAKVLSKIKAALNPEQQEELKEMKVKKRERMKERCDKRGGKSKMDKWLEKHGG